MSEISRRDALRKGAVGAAAAGAIWAAPRVEGLSLRPEHAAAQTGGPGVFTGDTSWRPNTGSPVSGSMDLGSAGTATIVGSVSVTVDAITGSGAVLLPASCSLTAFSADGEPAFAVSVRSSSFNASNGGFFASATPPAGGADTAGTFHFEITCT